jgi:membrane-associated phospholipid phosphatase
VASGAVQRTAEPSGTPSPRPVEPVIGTGRPPWWLLLVAALLATAVTADLLGRGVLEGLDLRVSEVVSGWDLRDSDAYWPIWVVTQAGGRGFILIVLAALVGWLAWRRRPVVLLVVVRVALALVLLTTVVYAFKWGAGRTAPAYPGSFFHRDGSSYPSGHVANAVIMWGVARWQVVQFGLADRVQRVAWVLSLLGPVATGVAMVALDFHWVTDAVVGAAVGVLLLGVVHLLDEHVLSRWLHAGPARTTS